MKEFIRRLLKEKVHEKELDEVGRPRVYTDDIILDKACQYKNARDFRNNDLPFYNAAIRNKLMLKIKSNCGYKALGNLYSRMIYMYIWESNVNAVYFGLTCDEDRRYLEHTKAEEELLSNVETAPNCKVGSNSAVNKFIQEHGTFDRYQPITDGYIDAEIAALVEMCLIDHFRNDPEWKEKIKVVNRSKGGELGGRCFSNARKVIKDSENILKHEVKSPEDFEKMFPTAFKYWSKDPQRKRIINQSLKYRLFDDAPYSKDEILNIVRNYDQLEKFKEENKRAFLSAKRNQMLDILFPTDKVFFNKDSKKTFYTLKDLNQELNVNFEDLYNDFKRGKGEQKYNVSMVSPNEIQISENKFLIKKILKEESSKLKLLNVIKDEGIFVAAEMVGGMDNLKRILKPFPDLTDLIDSLKGKLNLIYHSKKEYIEFPMKFEIVGKGINIHKTNSWPIVNLIYDDSNLSEREKKLFEQVVYDAIGDLTIDIVDIKPEAKKMFRERGDYMDYKYVNGRDWETLDHDIKYEDNDIRNLHREYYTKSYMNESKDVSQNKKVKLVTQMIYDLFDKVTNIEQSTYLGKPLLTIYFKTNSKAANITSWFAEYVIDEIDQLIGDNVVVLPFWVFHWDPRIRNVDIYINTKQSDEDGNVINESKTPQENEEDPTQKILNFLLRRYKVEDIDLGWEGNPIKFKTIKFDVHGEKYGFTTFENKREQIRKIVDMLVLHNVVEPIDPYEKQLDPYTQKVIRAVKLFINQVM